MNKNALIFAFIMAIFTFSSYAENSAATQNVDPFPWDFPQDVKLDAEPGQLILAPYTFYPDALADGKNPAEQTLIFYKAKMTEVGDSKSIVDDKVEMPNALIIPLAQNAKAKKGDILLTWWQSGSGLQRAIVKDASDPTAPKVDYLDMEYSDNPDKPGFANRHADEQIKPGTFSVITDGQWQAGAQVACKGKYGDWEAGTLIREQDGKVLVITFGSKVKAFKKENAVLIPFKEKFKKGDSVYAKWIDGYRSGYKVTKIDSKLGRIWIEREGRVEIKAVGEVTKVLNNL